jgi:broad specificity phosphatase PhoE
MSSSGNALYRVTDTEAWLIGFGIPPVAQEDLAVLYSSKKAYDDKLKADGKAVAKHAAQALAALESKNDEAHRTHSAVIQAILNSYSGADLQKLYREAYKNDAFTQYEKLLTDRAVREWKIRDIVTNTGATE